MYAQYQQQAGIPEQQCIGQTLPPVPVGIDTMHSSPIPSGAMPNGTWLHVGRYNVVIHNFIAQGGFAHVYLARIEGKTGYVVLKRIAVPDTERLQTVEKEIAFMRRLGDHKYIVRYYESRIDPLPIGGYEALILMEYCPGGGVIDLMNRRLQQRLTEPEILKIFSNVCEALAYMHYCQPPVLHRDLKVENILILSQDQYKLCDFGSASLSKGNYIPTTLQEAQKMDDDIQRHTTLQYRAPEMIDVYQKKPVNEKADIWALGVLLYKLCYYTTPFEEDSLRNIANGHYSIPQTPFFSNGIRQLITAMLQLNQEQRPNIYQVIKIVSDMMHVECPIRNIYQEKQTTPTAHQNGSPDRSTHNDTPLSSPEKRQSPLKEASGVNSAQHISPTKQENGSPEVPLPSYSPPLPTTTSSKITPLDTPDPKHQSPSALPAKQQVPDNESSPHPSYNSNHESVSISPSQARHRHTSSTSSAPTPASLQQRNASGGSSKSMTNLPSATKSTKSIRDFMEKKKATYAESTSPPPPSSSPLSFPSPTAAVSPKEAPYRPKLPPKPIRFRTKATSNEDDGTGDDNGGSPTIPLSPPSTHHRPPSISEFKEKFPSLDELDKML